MIELSKFLEMSNTPSAKAAAKRQAERERLEKEAKKPLIIAEISKYGEYSDEEKELIFQINERVMSVDGTAEQWGGYDFDPMEYIETSVEIFIMAKEHFSKLTAL